MSPRCIIFCILLLIIGCSEKPTVTYKTVVQFNNLQLYSNSDDFKEISLIPFKAKVEIIDNKITGQGLIKVKYQDMTGYVNEEFLSERDSFPFANNTKYDFELNEFFYDKYIVIQELKKILKDKSFNPMGEIYYYTDDPQIFSYYGEGCNNVKEKKMAVRCVSKLCKQYNIIITFSLKNNKMVLTSIFSDTNLSKATGTALIDKINEYDQMYYDESCD